MRLGVDRGTHLGQRVSAPHKTGRTHARSRTRSEILSPNPLHLRGRPHTHPTLAANRADALRAGCVGLYQHIGRNLQQGAELADHVQG